MSTAAFTPSAFVNLSRLASEINPVSPVTIREIVR